MLRKTRNRPMEVLRDEVAFESLKHLYDGKWGVRCEIWTPVGAKVDFDLTLGEKKGEKLFSLLTIAAKEDENNDSDDPCSFPTGN